MSASAYTRPFLASLILIMSHPISSAYAWEALVEPFNTTQTRSPDWTFIGDAHLTASREDPAQQGWLRLTDAQSNRRGVAYLNTPFPSSEGVVISFEYTTWGGIGADGMTAFLFDGQIGEPGQPAFQIGGWGGSLGYAQRCNTPGLRGAYIGIGIDEYGNFANTNECRSGGAPAGLVPDAISIRGPGTGTADTEYAFLTGTGTLPWDIDCPRGLCPQRPAPGDQGLRRILIKIIPNQGTYTVSIASQEDTFSPIVELIAPYTIPELPPSTLKFGYSASTGNSHNVHELRQLHIAPPVDIAVEVLADEESWTQGELATYRVHVSNKDFIDAADTALQHKARLNNATWRCIEGCTDSGADDLNITLDVLRQQTIILEVEGTVPRDVTAIELQATISTNDQSIDIQPDNNATTHLQPVIEPTTPVTIEPPQIYTIGPSEPTLKRPMPETPNTTEDPPPETPGVTDPEPKIKEVDADKETQQVIVLTPPLEEPRYEGTGCTQSPQGRRNSSSLMFLLTIGGLIMLSRRKRQHATMAIGALALCVSPTLAHAQTPASSADIQLEGFEPQPATAHTVLQTVGVPSRQDTLQLQTGALLHYAHRPLVLRTGDKTQDIIAHQLKAELGASLTWRRWSLDVTVPFVLDQQGQDPHLSDASSASMETMGLSDIRVVPGVTILRASALQLGIISPIHLPTGMSRTLNTDNTLRAGGVLVAQTRRLGPCKLLSNLGYHWRPDRLARNFKSTSQVRASLAGTCRVPQTMWQFDGAVFGDRALYTNAPIRQEVMMAIKWNSSMMQASLLAGKGIGTAPGTPTWRTGVQLQLRVPTTQTVTASTSCAWPVEDMDGFEDDDGCLDPDNDGDQVMDVDDRCPMVAGPDQGCPIKDQDNDGVPDALDACPKTPTDMPLPNDGCPSKDRDNDRVIDQQDACPDDPEDQDGYQDQDGCPDPDNDRDGIADAQDKCPNAPETVNGLADDDGCPDRVTTITRTTTHLKLNGRIFFDHDKATIDRQSDDLLKHLAEYLKKHPEIAQIQIIGHTNARGSRAHNMKLSRARARAVVLFLVARGIAPSRLAHAGMGSNAPMHTNRTMLGQALNRRVEFRIVKQAHPVEDRTP